MYDLRGARFTIQVLMSCQVGTLVVDVRQGIELLNNKVAY
jgi:hypothetical protein